MHLRRLRPDDRDLLLAGFERLSPESRYLRFFTPMSHLPESVLQRLLDVDGHNHVAIGAVSTGERGEKEGLGVARFVRLPDTPDTAEAAVAVVDHMQRRGLGKLLLSELAMVAREQGIARFRVEVLRTNKAIDALLRDLDRHLLPVSGDGAVAIYEIALPEPSAEKARAPLFDFLSLAARGLDVLLRRLHGDVAQHPPG